MYWLKTRYREDTTRHLTQSSDERVIGVADVLKLDLYIQCF